MIYRSQTAGFYLQGIFALLLTSLACFGDSVALETNEDPAAEESVEKPPPATVVETVEEPIDLDEHNWNLHSPLGQTAYVLDSGQCELGFFNGVETLYLQAPYMGSLTCGVTNNFTLGVGSTMIPAAGSLRGEGRLNFLNIGTFSMGIRLWGMVGTHSMGAEGAGATLAASQIHSERLKTHYSFTMGSVKNKLYRSYYSYYSSGYSNYLDQDEQTILRLSTEWEYRLAPRHVMSFSVAALTAPVVGGLTLPTLSFPLGFGYMYVQKHFSIGMALELGPGFPRYYSDFRPIAIAGIGMNLGVRL